MSQSNAVAVRHNAQIAEVPRRDASAVMEQVIVKGDLANLEPEERARFYMAVCQSVGLNPLTRPFLYVKFADGGLQLYPRKEAADQLRGIHKIQTRIVDQKVQEGIYLVVVEAHHPDGRIETDIGAVPVAGLAGNFLANAMKKAITQGKRRATLAMLGLSLIDDDEIRAIKGARFVEADPETGELLDSADTPVIEVPGTPALPSSSPSSPDRTEAVKALNAAIRQAFGQIDDALQVRNDIVCARFDLAGFKQATAEEIDETVEAVAGWSAAWAPQALNWLQVLAQATTPTMVADIASAIEDSGVDDAFVLAALKVRQEAHPNPDDAFAASGKVIDAALAP